RRRRADGGLDWPRRCARGGRPRVRAAAPPACRTCCPSDRSSRSDRRRRRSRRARRRASRTRKQTSRPSCITFGWLLLDAPARVAGAGRGAVAVPIDGHAERAVAAAVVEPRELGKAAAAEKLLGRLRRAAKRSQQHLRQLDEAVPIAAVLLRRRIEFAD